VEGFNNKAKSIVHKAHGFKTVKNDIRHLYHWIANLNTAHDLVYVCVRAPS
jgi:hypothetical protein